MAEVHLARQLPRFAAAGLVNTAVGASVVATLLRLGFGDIPANAGGIATGLTVSFLLNRRFTFERHERVSRTEVTAFLAVAAAAYLVNLSVLIGGAALGTDTLPLHAAAMASYAATSFLGMRTLAFGPHRLDLDPLAAPVPVLLALAALAAAIVPFVPIGHDVAWQFWIARQMNHGVSLYGEINEVNPPLWFWMAMPFERLAEALALTEVRSIAGPAMVALALAVSLLAARLLPDWDRRRQTLFVANAFVLGLLVAFQDFAQREHIAALAALPYTLLAARRAEGARVPLGTMLAAGALGAASFALKHYFVAVPLLLEAWLIWHLGRRWRPIRTETLILGVGAVAYVAAIALFTPAFFTHQMPMVLAAYDGYAAPLYYLVRGHSLLWVVFVATLLLAGWLSNDRRTPLLTALLLAAAGFCFSYAVQSKGWTYHAVPTSYFLALALLAALLGAAAASRAQIMAAGIFALAYLYPISAGPYRNQWEPLMLRAVEAAPLGAPVYVLSTNPRKSWPTVIDAGRTWPSRFMALWMVPAIALELGTPDELAAVSDQIRRETAEDLQCNPPAIIVVERDAQVPRLQAIRFDILRYFTAAPEGAAVMADYRLAEESKWFSVYHRRADARSQPRAGCRDIF